MFEYLRYLTNDPVMNIPKRNCWTIYSDLSNDELDYIIEMIAQDFSNDLFNENIPKEDRKLLKLIINKADNIDHKHIHFLTNQAILEKLCRIFEYCANLQLLAMEKLNYRDVFMGKDRVLSSYIRNYF